MANIKPLTSPLITKSRVAPTGILGGENYDQEATPKQHTTLLQVGGWTETGKIVLKRTAFLNFHNLENQKALAARLSRKNDYHLGILAHPHKNSTLLYKQMAICNSKIYDYYLGNMEGNHYSYCREKKDNCQGKVKNGHTVTSKPENGHLRKTSAKLEMKKLLEFIIQEGQNKTGYAMEKNTSKNVLISKPQKLLKISLDSKFYSLAETRWSREWKILSIAISP